MVVERMVAEGLMGDKKREMIEKSVEEFKNLNEANKMFILGYMVGVQQERQKKNSRPQTA